MLNEESGALAEQIAESRTLLASLLVMYPDDPIVNDQAAWTHDTMGREDEAIPYGAWHDRP